MTYGTPSLRRVLRSRSTANSQPNAPSASRFVDLSTPDKSDYRTSGSWSNIALRHLSGNRVNQDLTAPIQTCLHSQCDIHMTRPASGGKVTLVELTYGTLLALGAMGGWIFAKIHFGFWSACLFAVLGLALALEDVSFLPLSLTQYFRHPPSRVKQ
jgi:hypothetical protein